MTDGVSECNRSIRRAEVTWQGQSGRSCCRVGPVSPEHSPVALSNNRTHRMITFCALYFAQGIPWGFMLLTLPSYLLDKYGDQFGVDEIGRLKAIILVPWSFKLIWAPIMDSFTIRSMGRRRVWIIGAELMMALTLLGMIGMDQADKSH